MRFVLLLTAHASTLDALEASCVEDITVPTTGGNEQPWSVDAAPESWSTWQVGSLEISIIQSLIQQTPISSLINNSDPRAGALLGCIARVELSLPSPQPPPGSSTIRMGTDPFIRPTNPQPCIVSVQPNEQDAAEALAAAATRDSRWISVFDAFLKEHRVASPGFASQQPTRSGGSGLISQQDLLSRLEPLEKLAFMACP